VRVRITQIDGKVPNIALMRLGAWHRAQGDDVHWEHSPTRQLHEPDYDAVYGSAIFTMFDESVEGVDQLKREFPNALVGGFGGDQDLRVDTIVPTQFVGQDYGGYPNYTASLGYAMRGCRWKCGFCPVPKTEGAARSVATVMQIWRGEGHPRHLHLLDNDFFGNPEWRSVVKAINDLDFKVCINQGINVRCLTEEQAEAIASMKCRETSFTRTRIYMAWDNLGGERDFFRGVDLLEAAGVKPAMMMAYMLVGYRPRETLDEIRYRHGKMRSRGVLPYVMVHDRFRFEQPDKWHRLKRFQRWANNRKLRNIPWEEYSTARNPSHEPLSLLEGMEA
jgi:hypothetical protein